ncbi:uncharacterized protein EAF02_001769 [Botrytis sinoallii]|uniref:uncharacterized protein n=1 Tax=Botrytis sinoallii TaxID=1463999 RepID=UPI001900242F|nr:uncharacterized protein EAF02_001769 [Botrytis sinoallii]KAF7891444.1 hypothetical protein EAF02_001769 [Botrytis sinoallii]
MSSNVSRGSKADKSTEGQRPRQSSSHKPKAPQAKESRNDEQGTVSVSENRATRNKIKKLETDLDSIRKNRPEATKEIADLEKELSYQRSI